MFEVLSARPKDITREFTQNFEGMTAEPVELEDLLTARTALVDSIVGQMPEKHRCFLISFEKGKVIFRNLPLFMAWKQSLGFTLASELVEPDAVYCLGVTLKERQACLARIRREPRALRR